ncbi:MAG: alpha/beta hydrolase [Pseudomonadota bacterium]
MRAAGEGPSVVCLHSNASSSSQWRGLMDRMSPSHQVLAPDLYGAGKSPQWSSDRIMSLAQEIDFIEPVLQRAAEPFTLVGHSYGAAVALVAALQQPGRVGALALYEPTLFSIANRHELPASAIDGIEQTVERCGQYLDAGDATSAAREFIDYWMQPGSFDAMPDARKPAIVEACTHTRRWGHALTTEPTPLAAFGALDIPVLYMTGMHTTPAAKEVARLLTAVLPRVQVVEFERLGHMGPVTHPDVVNDTIADFLRCH